MVNWCVLPSVEWNDAIGIFLFNQLRCLSGREFPPPKCPFPWGIRKPIYCNTRFFGPPWVHMPNAIQLAISTTDALCSIHLSRDGWIRPFRETMDIDTIFNKISRYDMIQEHSVMYHVPHDRNRLVKLLSYQLLQALAHHVLIKFNVHRGWPKCKVAFSLTRSTAIVGLKI